MIRSRRWLPLAIATLLPALAHAGWREVGPMPAPTPSGDGVVFANGHDVVSVTALATVVVRVCFAPSAALGRDHSYAVVNHELGPARASVRAGTGTSEIATGERPLSRVEPVAFASAAGGWTIRDGLVVVKLADSTEALRIRVER